MATIKSAGYAANQPGISQGLAKGTLRLHDTVAVGTAANKGLTLADILAFGYLPVNAVVNGVTLLAQSQLDSNGSPTLAFDVGYAAAGTFSASPAAFMAATVLVGAASGATFDTTMVPAGKFLKNTSGAPLPIIVTVHTTSATKVAGVVELELTYFIEDSAGSQA